MEACYGQNNIKLSLVIEFIFSVPVINFLYIHNYFYVCSGNLTVIN